MQIPGPDWRTLVVGSRDLYFHTPTPPQVILLFPNIWKPLLFWDWCLLHGNNRKPSIRKVENCPRDQPLVHCSMPSYFCLVLIKLSNAWFMAHLVFYIEWSRVLGLFWGYQCYSPSSTLSPLLSISFFYSCLRLLISVYVPLPAGYYWAHFNSSAHKTASSTCLTWDQFTPQLFMGTYETLPPQRLASDARMWA